MKTIHTQGHYIVQFNSQVNAYRPYSVVNTPQSLARANTITSPTKETKP